MGLASVGSRFREFSELRGAERDEALMVAVRNMRWAAGRVAAMIADVDGKVAYADDGHGSLRAWVQAVTNSSRRDAHQMVAAARTLRDMPAVGEALHDGDLGGSQVDELVRLHANKQCATHLAGAQDLLVRYGIELCFDDFRAVCGRFNALADPDGTHSDHQAAHRNRRVSTDIVGTGFEMHVRGGSVDGAEMIEILDRFAQAEFDADWAELVARFGANAPTMLMARTPAQRRHDALLRIFQTAASAAGIVPPGVAVVNFVIDEHTFASTVAKMTGMPFGVPDPTRVGAYRSQTDTGVPVDPEQIVAAAMIGRVRRIIVDAAGVPVDVGRTRRLFTGVLRDVLLALGDRCWWPGCGVPAGRCEIDHATPWPEPGGETSAANANIACARHNRLKHHGYRAWRDPHGNWHTYRPDGTEIAPRREPPRPDDEVGSG